MHTPAAPIVAHQKQGNLAPRLTAFQVELGLGDLVLFGADGIPLAFAGGDADPVEEVRQVRAEQAAATYQHMLALSRGVDLVMRDVLPAAALEPAGDGVADIITLIHRGPAPDGGSGALWPVVIYPLSGTIGLVADLPPHSTGPLVTQTSPVAALGHELALLAEELRPWLEEE